MDRKFLIIQTAFAGDVILATAILETLKAKLPDVSIDFLVRKGNESLFENNPHIREVLIWNKEENKLMHFMQVLRRIRGEKYDVLINLQRFASSGILTAFSCANEKIGFDKNPLSFLFTKSVKHEIGNGKHEIDRNQKLISELTGPEPLKPRLYPDENVFRSVKRFKQDPYICVAPASVWFTKTFPESRWVEFLKLFYKANPSIRVYLIGSSSERASCERILASCPEVPAITLAGELSFLESAALMKNAKMNYVNDSAPLHMASAMNANVTAIFCSTIPGFGFGPLSDHSKIVELNTPLYCRPCGLHGFRSCPEKHFRCAMDIDINQLF